MDEIQGAPATATPIFEEGKLATTSQLNRVSQAFRDSVFPRTGNPNIPHAGTVTILCKVLGNVKPAAGTTRYPGFYNAQSITPYPRTTSPTATISPTDVGVINENADVTLINPGELTGGCTGPLLDNTFVSAVLAGGVDDKGRLLAIAIAHGTPLLVSPTADAPGGGKYYGSIVQPKTTAITATGDISETDFGDFGVDCLILNTAEQGLGAVHTLTNDGTLTWPGVLCGSMADGTPCVACYIVECDP